MSRGAFISVLGLYNYDNTLFDLMKYPTRFTTEDKETTLGNILGECAELEVLFPDINTFKNMIGLWSKLNFPTWERIYNLSLMEYNPIENYNRVETETITDSRTENRTGTESRTGTENRTGTEEHTGTDTNRSTGNDTNTTSGTNTETNSGTDTENNKTIGYDSNTLQLHDSSDITHGHVISSNSSGNSTVTYGKQDSFTHGENVERGEELERGESVERGEEIEHTGENVRTNETHGNIGVMSSQQMATQETELAPKLNVMSMIVESFKERFCILVY